MTFRNPNDLGRISSYFNMGLFTLPIIFIAIHFLLVYKTSKRENYEFKFNLVTFLLVLLFSSLWIGINQVHKVIII